MRFVRPSYLSKLALITTQSLVRWVSSTLRQSGDFSTWWEWYVGVGNGVISGTCLSFLWWEHANGKTRT
jgi:hypothetical protein